MNMEAHMKLPSPIKELYSLTGRLRYDKNLRTIEYLGKYRTALSQKKYGSWGNVSLEDINKVTFIPIPKILDFISWQDAHGWKYWNTVQ